MGYGDRVRRRYFVDGVRKGTTVVALIRIARLPVPLFIYKIGPRLRVKDAEKLSNFEDSAHSSQERFLRPEGNLVIEILLNPEGS